MESLFNLLPCRRAWRAFTLIELLVVIAIIAILAAILFPVFAQAKIAAKKTAALAQCKQQGTATAIYMTDSEDTCPTGWGRANTGKHGWFSVHYVPADWMLGHAGENVVNDQMSPGDAFNVTEPYRKSYPILNMPGMVSARPYLPAAAYTPGSRFATIGLAYNGLLHAYPSGGVAAPSQLPMYTQIQGNVALEGVDTGATPLLYCGSATTECRYVPYSPGGHGCGSGNGTYSLYRYPNEDLPNTTQWIYGRSQIWVYADTSAKARQLGMNIGGKTDFRVDPYTAYLPNGVDNKLGWYDENHCHALLFRPDFDFANFPTNPVADY